MKPLLLTLITMTLASFTNNPVRGPVNAKASQEMATQLIKAIQTNSVNAYVQLVPSLDDFKKVMTENVAVYGNNLEEAQREFAFDYTSTVIPSTKKSFSELIAEGKRRGIDWQNISLISWETSDVVEEGFNSAVFAIAIEAQNKIYHIEIEKAFYLQGQWKVSQFIKLV
jgi:hypothetical protein